MAAQPSISELVAAGAARVPATDKVICEALRPRQVSFRLDDTGEVALPTDVLSIAYRRLWKSLCSAPP